MGHIKLHLRGVLKFGSHFLENTEHFHYKDYSVNDFEEDENSSL
jgi:hypothetical protein